MDHPPRAKKHYVLCRPCLIILRTARKLTFRSFFSNSRFLILITFLFLIIEGHWFFSFLLSRVYPGDGLLVRSSVLTKLNSYRASLVSVAVSVDLPSRPRSCRNVQPEAVHRHFFIVILLRLGRILLSLFNRHVNLFTSVNLFP